MKKIIFATVLLFSIVAIGQEVFEQNIISSSYGYGVMRTERLPINVELTVNKIRFISEVRGTKEYTIYFEEEIIIAEDRVRSYKCYDDGYTKKIVVVNRADGTTAIIVKTADDKGGYRYVYQTDFLK